VNVKKVLILFLIFILLVPSSVAITQSPQENEKDERTEENGTNCKSVKSLKDKGAQPSVITACEIDPHRTKFRRERDDLRPNDGERTRFERDIWVKNVTIMSNPYKFDYTLLDIDDEFIYICDSFGIKGQDTTFTVTFQNNDSAGDVEIRLEIFPYMVHEDDGYDDDYWPIYWRQSKQVGSHGKGEELSVNFIVNVDCSRLLIVNVSAFEPGDPNPDNNEIWWLGRTLSTYCPGDNPATSPLENEKGNWHTRDVQNDPAPNEHSDSKAWYHGNPNGMSYSANNNTLALKNPVSFDGSIYDMRFDTFLTFTIAGNLDAASELSLYYDIDGGGWEKIFTWTTPWETNAEWDWAMYSYNDTYFPGIPMNLGNIVKVAINVESPAGGGVRPGIYIDEFQIFGTENSTIITPPPDPPYTSLRIENGNPGQIKDSNDNDVIDTEGDPGQEIIFPLKLTNTGTATISGITFEAVDIPSGWDAGDIVFEPSSVTTQLVRSEEKDIEVKVTIPDDARASGDFGVYREFNPHIITIAATATGIPPEVGDPEPNPAEQSRSFRLEANVTEQPALEVTVANDNITSKQGEKLDYTVTVENMGNCNLTDNINAEIAIRVVDTPSPLWTIQLSQSNFELEYENDLDFTVSVSSPQNVVAGYHSTELDISIEEFGISEAVILISGIEQVFGIEMDLKNKDDENIEIDPEKIGAMQQFVEFEITNTGNGDDSVEIVAEAGHSDDEKWFNVDNEELIELGPVGGGDDEKEFSIEFTVPQDADAGEHMFTVKATSENDPNGEDAPVEKNITFTVLRPDLELSTSINLDPTSPLKGEVTLISVKVYNNGTTETKATSIHLYIDDDLVGYQRVNILQKNQFVDVDAFEYVFEDDKEYEIKVVVDPSSGTAINGNVTEMDELNNEVSLTVQVIAPELQFTDEIVVSTAEEIEMMPSGGDRYDVGKGGTYKLSITVMNKGEADAKKVKVNLKIFYQDPMGKEIKASEENVTVSSISAGDSKAAEFTWMPELYGTDYYATFTVDPENKIFEEDESNNQWTPDENFLSEPEPVEETKGMEMTTIIGIIVVIVIIGAIVAVVLVLFRRKK